MAGGRNGKIPSKGPVSHFGGPFSIFFPIVSGFCAWPVSHSQGNQTKAKTTGKIVQYLPKVVCRRFGQEWPHLIISKKRADSHVACGPVYKLHAGLPFVS